MCLAGICRPNREFWISLGVVCDDKVAKAKELLGETEEGVATGGLHKVSDFRRLSAAVLRLDECNTVAEPRAFLAVLLRVRYYYRS